VMLETSRSLYRRENGGAWSVIMDYATARALAGGAPAYSDVLVGFCVDPLTDGRLWVTYKYQWDALDSKVYALRSDDYGDSWTAIIALDATVSAVGSPRCAGDSIFIPVNWGAGGSYNVVYSANAGVNWHNSAQAAFGILTNIAVNPLTGIAYIEQDVLATRDLAYLEDDGTTGTLQADITLDRNDIMWFNPADADHQRLVHSSRLYVTNDAWTNRNTPGAISPSVISIAPWAGTDTDQMLVGLTLNHGAGQDHAVAALYGEDDTSAAGIAGASPDAPPYTDSIPYGCGGVCSMGVQAVEGAGAVHTYSVAMPGYAGTERGEPVPGDRASWETGVTHADDIQDASFQYHNNPADPPMLVSDYDSDDDGIVDAAETAPWAGITDKPTEFTPEDHDHSGDAGDGGTFDAANLTSGASTDGQVLTSDGAGGAAWEDPAGVASALDDLTDVNAPAPDDGDVLTWDDVAGEWVADPPPAGGVVDAADVTYTPTTAADWDGGADPGNADDAFDQLAERVKDIEDGGGGASLILTDWNYRNIHRSSSEYAFKGNLYTPSRAIHMYALAYYGSVVAEATYAAMIITISGGLIASILATSETVTINAGIADTADHTIWFRFASPVALSAETEYGFIYGRTDGADNYALPCPFDSDVTAPFDSDDGIGEGVRIADATPGVGSTVESSTDNVAMGFAWTID